jgi:hypothetical protein
LVRCDATRRVPGLSDGATHAYVLYLHGMRDRM